MRYREMRADVTKLSKEFVICHCISTDCAMGAGVVVPIRKKHKMLKEKCIDYVNKIGNQNALGTAFRVQDEAGTCYNMFSKMFVRDNCKNLGNGVYLKNLKLCLSDMKRQMINNGEKYLAMPKIGSGLDRCEWEDVKTIIKEVFSNTDISIMVCLWN